MRLSRRLQMRHMRLLYGISGNTADAGTVFAHAMSAVAVIMLKVK